LGVTDRSDRSSDEALLAGMATGDERAATELVRRYQGRVYGLAYSVLGESAGAEEVAQEALLRVWRHAAVFDPRRGAVSTWVLTITRNLAIDALRLRRATPVDPDTFSAVPTPAGERTPEDAAMSADGVPAVRAALAALPHEQRRAVVLAAVYGKTAAEISESERIPLGTAKTRIRAGLLKLRAALVDDETVGWPTLAGEGSA
jgi:RNA polymerase sigma-70 factor (ECF subfamily)